MKQPSKSCREYLKTWVIWQRKRREDEIEEEKFPSYEAEEAISHISICELCKKEIPSIVASPLLEINPKEISRELSGFYKEEKKKGLKEAEKTYPIAARYLAANRDAFDRYCLEEEEQEQEQELPIEIEKLIAAAVPTKKIAAVVSVREEPGYKIRRLGVVSVEIEGGRVRIVLPLGIEPHPLTRSSGRRTRGIAPTRGSGGDKEPQVLELCFTDDEANLRIGLEISGLPQRGKWKGGGEIVILLREQEPKGRPLKGAKVYLYDETGQVIIGGPKETDEKEGYAGFSKVPFGRYLIRVQHGEATWELPIQLTSP